MKKILLKDLMIREKGEKIKRVPKFIGMTEKNIYEILYCDYYIYWIDKDWLQIYYEDSQWDWSKREDHKMIQYKYWKYYINWTEAELI